MSDSFERAYNEVTERILKEFITAWPGENLVFSPYSIYELLTVAANAVNGESRQQIVDTAAKGMSYDDLLDEMKKLRKLLEKSAALRSADAVLVNSSISASITRGYEQQLKTLLDGSFIISSDIVTDANAWVTKRTGGMIREIADNSMKNMEACLLNAIAFNAEWKHRYEENDIYEDDFTNADGTVSEVNMLGSTEDEYLENDFFTGFVRPYKNHYSFIALLPKETGEGFLLQGLETLDLSDLYRRRIQIETHVTIPEFEAEFGQDITEFCKAIGIRQIFTPFADFSPMSSEWLKLEQIIHKARIEVNRKGTKAAAVTMSQVVPGCCPDIESFKSVYLDRPFLYAVVHNGTGLPVFIGAVNRL